MDFTSERRENFAFLSKESSHPSSSVNIRRGKGPDMSSLYQLSLGFPPVKRPHLIQHAFSKLPQIQTNFSPRRCFNSENHDPLFLSIVSNKNPLGSNLQHYLLVDRDPSIQTTKPPLLPRKYRLISLYLNASSQSTLFAFTLRSKIGL